MMNNIWRNSCLRPRLFGLDAKLAILFVMVLVHVRVWTLAIVSIVIITFVVIEIWRKISIEITLRFARSALAGRYRPAYLGQEKKFAIDFGYAEKIAKPVGQQQRQPAKRAKS